MEPRKNNLKLSAVAIGLAFALSSSLVGATEKGRHVVPEKHTVRGHISGLEAGHRPTIKVTGKLKRTVVVRHGGDFEVRDLPPGNYTMRPVHPKYTFFPSFASVAVHNHDVDLRDFSARAKPVRHR